MTSSRNFPFPLAFLLAKPTRSETSPRLLTLLAGFLLFILFPFVEAETAEIGLDRRVVAGSNPPVTVAAVIVSGQIEEGDARKVKDLLAEIIRTDDGHQVRRLLIHSPGGFIGEAMDIGKMLRANKVEVFIPQGTSCISACVLVLAGAATRTIVGQVGIDYPHFLQAAGPNDDVPALLAEGRRAMKDYFVSMGVAGELADAMFAVTPGVVRFLTPEELRHYRLK